MNGDKGAFVALMTPRGRGAVATVAFHGDVRVIDYAALFRAANGRPLADQPLSRTVFGHWGGDAAEEVVVCRTAEDRLEIHGHGGDAAGGRILSQLEAAGAERLDWRTLVERVDGAFAADVAQALAAATTPRTAAVIARQAEGPLRETLRRLASADPIGDREEIRIRLAGLLIWSDFGLHLTRPWQVVLYGRPNVGKSSLINALVGFERAIVFDQPGTTRDVVTAETAFDGWPVQLSDTAGLRAEADELDTAGIERAHAALAEADLRVRVEDRSRPPEPDEFEEATGLAPHVVVLNKSDLPDSWREARAATALEVSATQGHGLRELMGRISRMLVPEVPSDDMAMPIFPRQVDSLRSARAALTAGDHRGYHRAVATIRP